MVEYEFTPHEITQDGYCITCDSNGCNLYEEEKYSLKLTPNNEIIIHPAEEKFYTRKEIDILINKALSAGINYGLSRLGICTNTQESGFRSNWIKENL